MPQLTRGPHDPGVYWRRRVFVVLTALTLVFVVAQVLGIGSDGDDPAPAATQVAAEPAADPTPDATGDAGDPGATPEATPSGPAGPLLSYGPTYDPDLLVEPEGACTDDDITVTPSVDDAVVAQPVTLVLSLRTVDAEACTWSMSPSRLTVKLSNPAADDPGNLDGTVWTTQDCPDAVPEEDVVVRRALATPVEITWSSRESGEGCPSLADWAVPGQYTIDAAALGGEPASATFTLARSATPETAPADGEPTDPPARPGRPTAPRDDDTPSGPPTR